MFRIACFVEDKHLAAVMHALGGKALNLEVAPVTNAVPVKGAPKVKQEVEGASKQEQLISRLRAYPEVVITTDQIKKLVEAVGGKASSANNYIVNLKDLKILKPRARGSYEIKKEEKAK